MKKLVIFDWNGTLLSDTATCLGGVNAVLALCGQSPIDVERYRRTVTFPVMQLYTNNGCKEEFLEKTVKKLAAVFHTTYEQDSKHCRTRKGTRELLRWLKDNGIKSVLISNHTLDGISIQFKRLGLGKLITEIYANSDGSTVLKTKNKGEKGRAYMRKHGYKPSEVVIVGDSTEEIEIGHELDITSVAITDGFYDTARLKAAKPDYLITNLLQLRDIVKK